MEEDSKGEQTVEQAEEQPVEQQTAEQTDPGKERLKCIIACLIFASDIPLTVERIRQVLEDLQPKQIRVLVEELIEDYRTNLRGIYLREVAHGFQFCTRPEFAPVVQKLRKSKPYHLTQPTL